MADPYTPVSITGYNSNPPVDDGSQTEANRVKWSTIKTKITDPVKTRTDTMDTNIAAAFGKVDSGVTSTAISYTVISTDQGKLVRATASGITITTPDATDVDSPFVFELLNDSSGDITLDGSGSQTVDGDASVTVPAGTGARVRTDGSNWFTGGQNFQRTLIVPQGRLTPVSATPVIAANAAVTSLFYTFFVGNLIPIPNGTLFNVREFSELTLTLVSAHAASTIYDVFIFDNSGTLTIGTGPAWTNSAAGAGSRGTGAGTTELERLKGMFVNKVSMTARNGSTTYTVDAKSGIYVGSIFIDTVAGQVTCHVDFGQARKWGVWNAYNRKQVFLKGGDSTASWTTATTNFAQSRADANNFVHVFSGLPEEAFDLRFTQMVTSAVGVSTSDAQIGLGYNSTSVLSGREGQHLFTSAGNNTLRSTINAEYNAPPALGLQKINALEKSSSGTVNNTYHGTEAFMLYSARYYA